MRVTVKLFQSAVRITLFSHDNCSLCTTAKDVLQKMQTRRPFDFEQIDIMKPGNESWKDMYAFDVPVIHVQGTKAAARGEVAQKSQKLMHRFSEQDVEQKMELVKEN